MITNACKHGHRMNKKNTYVWKGERHCRRCCAISKRILRLLGKNPETNKKCEREECGNVFKTNLNHKRFCSKKCQDRTYSKKHFSLVRARYRRKLTQRLWRKKTGYISTASGRIFRHNFFLKNEIGRASCRERV